MLSIEEAKSEVTQFSGISIHGKSIRISFMYQGKRRLETLKNVALTKSNIKGAYIKRMSICHDIELGKFDYAAAFPNSKVVLKDTSRLKNKLPVNMFLDKYSSHSRVNNRQMTHRNNEYRINNYIRPKFGHRCITTIKVSEIKEWINTELSHLANKTISEVLTPLRSAFKYALDDELIRKNPLDLINNPKRENKDSADPFSREEIKKISSFETNYNNEKVALLFAIWTGLRPSELLALSICDIDLDNKKLYVRRSVVRGIFASTKTSSSYRCIDLIDEAYEIIRQLVQTQKEFKSSKVAILQPNNRLSDVHELQFIFTSSKSNKIWSGSESFNKEFVKPHCESAGVRYRGIGQARHTYGSQLITAGINLNWIAKQMGHTSIKMLEKHYGRWMESEVPNMASQVSNKLKALDVI